MELKERRKLPVERSSITHKFKVGKSSPTEVKGYLTVGLYDDGTPGEVFIKISKEGSTLSGTMDCFSTAISFALQYGVPLQFLVRKFTNVSFEPSGFTGNEEIPTAKSVVDYVFKWLGNRFLDKK